MNDPCIIINSGDQLYFLEFSDRGIMGEEVVRKIITHFAYSMPKVQIVDSCHGLLCVRDRFCHDFLYVFNSFTREYYLKLPISVTTYMPRVVLGFGFHPVTKEYKLIKVTSPYFHSGFISNVEVFTLGNSRWRSVAEIPYVIRSSTQVNMLNGKMHWLAGLRDYNGPLVRHIISFDLADEVFGEVPQVDFSFDFSITHELHLAVIGGCLAVVLIGRGLEIWVMKEYNVKESWIKEFKIGSYTPYPNSVTEHLRPQKFLCMLKNGELLVKYRGSRYLVSYDPKNCL